MAKIYTADFETSTEEWVNIDGYARVWAWSICNIQNVNDIKYGTSIDSFFEFCEDKYNNYTLYFHNLKFDGEYILAYLLANGYENVKSRKERKDKSFTTIISDTGLFYGIEIFFKVNKSKVNKVTIYDSFKILSFSVDKIAKDFNLPITKLNLDYTRYREIGYELKNYEIRYIQTM
jgi:DNA polymerase type B, organellar and viral.